MRNLLKYPIMICLLIATYNHANATIYYSRTNGGNWNDNTTWSTVTYGNATNTGTFPKTTDSAYIGDGYLVMVNLTQTTNSIFIGQGSSGTLEFASAANYTLTVQNSMTINTNGKVWYNSNSSRTHSLVIGGSLTNNGTLDLYSDADDIANLTFNRGTNGVISGSGTFDLNTVTLGKTTSTSFSIDVQSTTFESGIRDLVLNYGTYYHNNSSTYSVNPSAGSGFTVGSDVNLKISQGVLNVSPNQNDLTLNGIITITGGTLRVGSNAGLGGIKYDKTASITPKIDISGGMIDVYGGITFKSGAGSDPVYFAMSNGTLQLNTGSTGTSGAVFNVNDVAGSTFIMTAGSIILSQNNTTGSTISDFSICGNSGSVTVGGGTLQFGDENTTDGTVFSFTPISTISLPNIQVTGSSLTTATLCPSNNSTDNIKCLSLFVDLNKTFDIRSIAGTTGDTRSLVLTGTIDGVNAMVVDGTLVTRTSTMLLSGGEMQQLAGTDTIDVYNLEINNPDGAFINQPIFIANQLVLTDGIIYSQAAGTIILLEGATADVGTSTSYIDGKLVYEVASTSSHTLNLPIGKDGVFRPMVLQVQHTSSSSTMYTAEMLNTSARTFNYTLPGSLERVSAVRYFTISRSGAAGLSNAAITINYDSDDWVSDESNLRIAAYDGSSSWINLGGTGTSNPSGSITSTTFSTFRTIYALGNSNGGSNPLPVTFLNFSVNRQNSYVNVVWSTASETNNDYFLIERSSDAINFISIGKVYSAINSSEVRDYSFKDFTPLYKNTYYRIKQIDINGQFSYTSIRVLKSTDQLTSIVYPNPAPPTGFKINLPTDNGLNIDFRLIDSNGIAQFSGRKYVDNGSLNIDLDKQLESGLYIVQISSDNNEIAYETNVIIE